MDNSSRNTVIFIATITFSAMLLMAAHFYADWKKEETAQAPTAAVAAPVVQQPSVEETPATDQEEEEFPEEEDFPAMGEPTVDLDENDSPAPAPAPLPAPQPVYEQQVPQDYAANN
ncbi:MAG: hypothetical protein IBJ12_08185 [Sphingomonadaceae bacterium]|nr:hypothetical protein [Sphingomonadaceae bacterium]